jgi:PPP family 3-phenylpropionic acid transporter
VKKSSLAAFALNAFYMFVQGAVYPLFPMYLRGLGVDELARGYVLTGSAAASGIAALFWGWLSDKTGERRRWAVLGGACQAVVNFLMALLPLGLHELLAFYYLSGFLGAAPLTLAMASINEAFEETGEGFGSFWAGGSLGWAVATAASGYILEKLSFRHVLIITVPMIILYSLMILQIGEEKYSQKFSNKERETYGMNLRFCLVLFMIFIFVNIDVVKNLYIPVHYAFDVGLGIAASTLTLSLASVLEIPSILFFSKLIAKVGAAKILSASLGLAAAYAALNAAVIDANQAFAVMGFYSLVWGSFSVSSSLLVGEASEDKGAAYGAYNTVFSIANIIAPSLAGMLARDLGYEGMLITLSCVALAACLVSVFALQRKGS